MKQRKPLGSGNAGTGRWNSRSARVGSTSASANLRGAQVPPSAKTSVRLAALFFTTLSFCGELSAAAPAGTQAALDAWIAGKPGGVTAAWVDADGVTFFQAGKFSATDARPVGPHTVFEIGSITKVFTALLLADSVRAGKVELEGTVGAPFAPSKITYRQLATHTSGLPAIPPEVIAADQRNPYGAQTLPKLTASFDVLSGGAKESAWAYSNLGFGALGQSLAGAWGQPYETLLAERVLGPLGLTETTLSWRAAEPALLPPGHIEGGREQAPNWDLAAYAPAGALVSSATDLSRFLQANLGLLETPLAAELSEIAKPLKPIGDGSGAEIGLAWLVEKRGASAIAQHGGGTGGYRSFVAFERAKRVGVVVLTNHADDVGQLGRALIADSLSAWQARMKRLAAPPDESVVEYLGNYPISPEFVLAITANGTRLAVQATGQPRLGLKAGAAKDRFSLVGVEAEISFVRAAGGKIEALILHQGGVEQRAKRLPPGERPKARAEVTLDAAVLAEYPGTYPLSPAFVLTVTVEAGNVFVQATGQPRNQIFAEAKDEFFLKVVDARVSFTRDAGGKVSGLILRQGGRDTAGTRVE